MNISFMYTTIIFLFCSSRVIYPMNDVAEVYHHLAEKVYYIDWYCWGLYDESCAKFYISPLYRVCFQLFI